MSDETLITAAHRLNRFFRIDEKKGGLTTEATLQAYELLEQQIAACEAGALHDAALLAAAKDARRRFNIDEEQHGGLTSVATVHSFDQLDKAIRAVGGRPAAAPVASAGARP